MDTTNIHPFKLVKTPLFVWLMVASVGLVCFSFLVTLGVTRLLLAIGKIGFEIVNLLFLVSQATEVGSNIQIPRNSSELHPSPCMRDVCYVCGLGPSCTLKQNVLSLILLILLVKFTNQKRGICRRYILYPLRLGLPFPKDADILRPKVGLGPNQMLN